MVKGYINIPEDDQAGTDKFPQTWLKTQFELNLQQKIFCMITNDQIKELSERRNALRRFL
jgi:hypothetical protein